MDKEKIFRAYGVAEEVRRMIEAGYKNITIILDDERTIITAGEEEEKDGNTNTDN